MGESGYEQHVLCVSLIMNELKIHDEFEDMHTTDREKCSSGYADKYSITSPWRTPY